MPPRKAPEDGTVDIHASFVPLTTPLSFVNHTTVCYVVGGSVCLWDYKSGKREFVHTSAYCITKICGNPERGLLAFCEGGTSPQVFVYSVDPNKLLFTLSDVTELELADLAFSRCGSRLYTLSRATTKRLCVFSMHTGKKLLGCEVELPLRFDKVSVYPGHKDQLALIRSSSVRIVTLQKSYETYIARFHPSSIPTDIDLSVSAYSWTVHGQFVFATRQGLLCTLDGTNGQILHACQVEQPITSIVMLSSHMMTAHVGNVLKMWKHDHERLTFDCNVRLVNAPLMESDMEAQQGIYRLRAVIDLDRIGQENKPELFVKGQVAHLQSTPDFSGVVLTTAEGEVWTSQVPELKGESADSADLDIGPVMPDPEELRMQLISWFHTHPLTDVMFLGQSLRICASTDEGGRFRIWDLGKGSDPKGFRLLRFASTITGMTADDEGTVVVLGTDTGCLHVVNATNWKKVHVLDSLRISDSGISQVCCVTHEARVMTIACSLFNHRIAFCTISLRDPKIRMLGFVDGIGNLEDICFHTRDFKAEALTAPKLLAVSSYQHTANEPAWCCLWCIQAPPMEYEPGGAELKREVCPVWCTKIQADTKMEDKATAVVSASKKTAVVGYASGALKVFNVPTNAGAPTAKQAVATPADTLPSHDQLVSRLSVSKDGLSLISAAMDGQIRSVPMEGAEKGKGLRKLLHNPYNGGVVQCRTESDSSVFLSTGGADGILVWTNQGGQFYLARSVVDDDDEEDEYAIQRFGEINDKDVEAYPLWTPKAAEEQGLAMNLEADDPELNAVALAQKKALVLEVENLRKKLRILVDANAHCPELEQMERYEFCVDIEERDRIAQLTRERCNALRAQINQENLARQLLRDRLIKEFWDPMKSKGCQVNSLMSNLSVSNYPERTIVDQEKSIVNKLRNMRNVELMERNMLRSNECPPGLREDIILDAAEFTTGEESYILNWWPKDGKVKAKEAAKTEGQGEGEEETKEESKKKKDVASTRPEPKDQKLLYEPFQLLTNARRRLQIHLLQSLANEYRNAFNDLFKKAAVEKKNVVSEICEKLGKIRGILGELQVEEHVPEVKLHEMEEEGSVLKVKDWEISVEKWISEDEKKLIAEAEAKEAERLRQLRENDAGQRALMQMMGGTLKTKKDLSALEITLDREPWMDQIEYEDMSDMQKQAMNEFAEKEKALAEEQDKYKKQLDADLKRTRQEILECQQQFEVALKELHHQRFEHDAKVFCQDLYCVRLQLALLQSVEDSHVLKQLMQDLQDAQTKLGGADKALEKFGEQYHMWSDKQNEKIRHDREIGLAQHFRAQFASSGLENEAIGALLQIFRRRKGQELTKSQVVRKQSTRRESEAGQAGQRRQSEAGKTAQSPPSKSGTTPSAVAEETGFGSEEEKLADPFDRISVGDPYADLGTGGGQKEETIPDDDISMDELPEGVDEANFKHMLQLRAEKIKAEQEVAKGNAVLHEMAGLLAHYQQERDEAQADYDRLQLELTEHRHLMDRELFDIEILFKLKQGQVEVQQAAVVTDYSDAVVIDKEVVESRNRRILQLGQEKVGTLGTTKEFRKKLNLIHWEHKMLEMQTLDLEERTKDVHMLRVTKNLQILLKGGEEGKNKADADLLERKIQHLEATTQQKEASLKKQYAMSSHATKLRKMENNMLEKKLRELQQNVIQREHIRRLRAPQGGAGGQSTGQGQKPRIIGGGGRIEENEGAVRLAQTSFREVKTRQTLMDAAKKHTEEIELLRKELDRLRQKTFPSFVQVNEDRAANPDHKALQ
jgi:WD40 repeat protein